MDNDAFRIVARLDVPKSAKLIKDDIPDLEKELQSDSVKIKAELNTTESKKLIQAQLDTLTNQSKAPTIKVGIDTSAVKKAVKDTSAQISNSNKSNQLQLFDSKKLDAEGRKYFYKTTDIISHVKNYYLKNGALNVDISSLETAKGQIQSFTATVEESTGVIKKFNFEKANINSKKNFGFVQTDSLKSIDKNAGANLKSTLNFLSQIDEKIMSIQSKTTKQSNPLKEGTTYYDNYNKKLTETVSKIEEIKNANKTLSTEQKNEIKKMITELSLYAKEQQKLAYPPMISSTSIEDSVEKAKATLSTLEQKWKTQGILTGEFKAQVVSLRTELDQVGNTEGLKKYNTSLKLVQESAKQLLSTEKQYAQVEQDISNTITKLNSLSNSSVFSKNTSNPQVAQTKQELADLAKEYQKLMAQMQGDITPAGLETLGSELNKLNTRFNSACASAEQFERELKDDNSAEQLAQKVSVLTNRIEAFRKANSKSEKLFGGEYDRILSQLSEPNIDLQTYNRLNKEFQKLRLEINKADKAGKNLWQTFKEKLTKFTGWMSMTYAVTLFTSNVRSAVSELKEMDSILTEISKTSNRTEESLKKLGKDSFTTASKYGRTASDYLIGVQEMSRAGFGEKESEQMAELSILAQSAGDMTAELANEYLIATNAGYQLGGSAEKLNSVLDSQNFITNRNALNMSELAEATKIVSSQAAQSGIGIDEMTAAVGTMIATTQQGGEVAARSLKGILMNLQQVKGTADEIGDGGEDITDESLTKYEKACLDLGVALKEVKNGVTVLRDPMQILEELASSVAKESEDSIKVANLINAVGGKYRGGQLAALLRNWETYSKMLSEFNSQEAAGSAFEESMKSANNWQGKLNELSNEWNKFVNNFANSDMMIKGIDSITQIIKLIEKLTSTLGTLPTVLGGVAAVLSAKNVGELQNKNTPVSIQPQIICIENVTRLKIRLSNCWDDYAKAL